MVNGGGLPLADCSVGSPGFAEAKTGSDGRFSATAAAIPFHVRLRCGEDARGLMWLDATETDLLLEWAAPTVHEAAILAPAVEAITPVGGQRVFGFAVGRNFALRSYAAIGAGAPVEARWSGPAQIESRLLMVDMAVDAATLQIAGYARVGLSAPFTLAPGAEVAVPADLAIVEPTSEALDVTVEVPWGGTHFRETGLVVEGRPTSVLTQSYVQTSTAPVIVASAPGLGSILRVVALNDAAPSSRSGLTLPSEELSDGAVLLLRQPPELAEVEPGFVRWTPAEGDLSSLYIRGVSEPFEWRVRCPSSEDSPSRRRAPSTATTSSGAASG